MTASFYVAEFQFEEDRYVAAGRDPLHLPVYEVTEERCVERTRMFYPSCLKVMPDAIVSDGTLVP